MLKILSTYVAIVLGLIGFSLTWLAGYNSGMNQGVEITLKYNPQCSHN